MRVIRDGQPREVPTNDVVLGDYLLLAAGEPIVADGTVEASRYLEVDEALLTGESDPVPRHPGDRVLSGSFCVAGEGAYRADKVGATSFANQTSAEARAYHYSPSPLQRSIDVLIRVLTYTAVILCVLYVGLYWLRGFATSDLVEMIAATITSMVPQGLVVMTTVAFSLGAVRMSLRGAIVQRLNAVESMAAVNVLCLDKTGTLTTNHLKLQQVRILVDDLTEEAVRHRLRLFASASVDQDNRNIMALKAALGEVKFELLDQLPFKSQNRYRAVRVGDDGREHVLIMGACEALAQHLEATVDGGWQSAWKELLTTGQRLLLFAEANPATP